MRGVIGGGYTAARPGSNGFEVTGDLSVTEDATVTGNLAVTGNSTVTGNLVLGTAGGGLQVKEGANASMGVATLTAGTVTVNTTKVTATSRIMLTIQAPGGTVGAVYVSARVAGTSFTIASTSNVDTSTVAWIILEPAP